MALSLSLALKAHEGQVRKDGSLQVEHVERVASRLATDDEKVVAHLHDVLEDTGIPYLVLVSMFGQDVANDVLMVSAEEGESYGSFTTRITLYGSDRALRVKLADLQDNLGPGAPNLRPRYLRADERLRVEAARRGLDVSDIGYERKEVTAA